MIMIRVLRRWMLVEEVSEEEMEGKEQY